MKFREFKTKEEFKRCDICRTVNINGEEVEYPFIILQKKEVLDYKWAKDESLKVLEVTIKE